MRMYNVLRSIYIDNNDNDFFKYEIIGEHDGNIEKAIVFARMKLEANSIDGYTLIEIDELTFDNLEPPQNGGFPNMIGREMYPGKSLGSVVEECKKHRVSWNKL